MSLSKASPFSGEGHTAKAKTKRTKVEMKQAASKVRAHLDLSTEPVGSRLF